MLFKNLCFLIIWTKVDLVLEGLKSKYYGNTEESHLVRERGLTFLHGVLYFQ